METQNNYPEVVTRIHKAFDTAADALYKKAEKITIKDVPNVDKAQRLKQAGFSSTKEVEEITKQQKKIQVAKKAMELVKYYREKYPLYKFITEQQMRMICKKYNLIDGALSDYLGFVPEKSLKALEEFKLDREDRGPDQIKPIEAWSNAAGFPGSSQKKAGALKLRKLIGRDWIDTTDPRLKISTWARQMDFHLDNGKTVRIEKTLERNNQDPIIAAAAKDMKETSARYTLRSYPDPIVLQPVNGGYLIITAWGDEASDPDVVNEINN